MNYEMFRNHSEKDRRLIAGQEAHELGRGGITYVASKYRMSRSTVRRGVAEYLAGETYREGDRNRKKGGGRKKASEMHPGLIDLIIEMIEKENADFGSPCDGRKWCSLSPAKIARVLKEKHGIDVSRKTVWRILKKKGVQEEAEQEDA